MTSLESKLFEDWQAGRDIDVERGLLIAAGLETEKEIAEYTRKIDEIEEGFWTYAPTIEDELQIARSLHEFLWHEKANRYNDNFLLTQVLDAQLNDDENATVGDCVGLTSLYTVLGLRQGLNLTILEPLGHVLSRLRVGQKTYDIENTGRDGFGVKENLSEKPTKILIPLIYTTLGIVKKESGNLEGAIADYKKAIQLDPEYAIAYYNHGLVNHERNDLKEAINNYNKAIQHNLEHPFAYCNRGIAKYKLGELQGAITDFNKAIQINPDFTIAKKNLKIAKQLLSQR